MKHNNIKGDGVIGRATTLSNNELMTLADYNETLDILQIEPESFAKKNHVTPWIKLDTIERINHYKRYNDEMYDSSIEAITILLAFVNKLVDKVETRTDVVGDLIHIED